MTRSFLSALACSAAFASAIGAQRNSVVGVVRDSAGIPIPSAEVTAGVTVARSDSLGRFYLSYPRADSVTLVVRRMGFERVAFTISSAAAAENSIEVTMRALPAELPRVHVDAASIRRRTVMEGFDRRRKQGNGVFVTKEDIERRHTEDLSNVLRSEPGIVIQRGRNGRMQLKFLNFAARNCGPTYWVDGRKVQGFEIDEMPAGQVEAVELYSGPSTTPGEFMRGPEINCGTVVIWSKVPTLNAP